MTDKTPQQSELAGTDTVDRANHNAKLDQLEAFRSDATGEALRTNQGVKIADNQNTLKAGGRGPSLLEDFIMREKITHFDHERIPERIVHARGAAAHGVFVSYADHSWLTKASFLAAEGKETPVFVRFSTVQGSRGSADTVRDVRGFATKFYTDEGNFDWSATTCRCSSSRTPSSSRLRPRGETRAAQRDPAGAIGPRYLLGFRLADA